MATEAKLLTVQFLDWVASRERTQAETRAAWGSTCPLNCAWEDALADDLIALTRNGGIVLIARGRSRLEERP